MVPVSHRPCNATISVTLPSSNTRWNYIKMEPDSSRLFMAGVQDGLTVFDVDTGKVVPTVENSTGANGPLLLPEYNRGYVEMTDGSVLIFDLKTLKPIERKIYQRNTFVVLTYKPE